MRRAQRWATWVSLCLLATGGSLRGATLNVNPGAVSNTFGGTITLSITDLTNGEPVVLEKFQDADGSGGVDAGEGLVASFPLQDGQVSSIGGVRNRNVPGDDDRTANGEIRVTFTLAGMGELERAIGSYVFQVSSPGGRFPPVSQTLVIQPTSFAQSISGVITNANGAPLPYSGVAALESNQEFVAAATANAAGAFTLPLAPGNYQLVGFASGHVADLASQPQVNLIAGQNLTVGLPLIAGTRTASGRVRNAQTRTGIAGAQLFFEADSGHLSLGFADASGNFSFQVTPGVWRVEAGEKFGIAQGYLAIPAFTTVDTTAGNVSGIQIELTKGTCLVYGRLVDDRTNAVPGIRAYAYNASSSVESGGLTDANGDYFIAAAPGEWSVGFSSEMLAAIGLIIPSTNTTLTAGVAQRIHFVALRPTSRIRGFVYTPTGVPIARVMVMASRSDGPGLVFANAGTGGEFQLPVVGGNWRVQLEPFDTAQRGLLAPMREVVVTEGVDINDFVLTAPSIDRYITGRVTNHLGQAITELDVYASASAGMQSFNANARTDTGGNYTLGVTDGTWHVGLSCEQVWPRGYPCPDEQLVTLSGRDQTLHFSLTPLLAPRFAPPTVVGNTFASTVNGQPGVRYRVRYTTDLVTWSDLGGLRYGPDFQVTDSVPGGAARRFYRVEVVQ